MQILQPPRWPRPRGYANGVVARGDVVFVAGQVAWNERAEIVSSDFVAQVRQVLSNVVAILAEAGARPEHLTRMTWFVTDLDTYRAASREIGQVYREVVGTHYPAMTLVKVAALLEDGAKVEVEATAVIPPED